jgi:lysophospholipid acyltransferase (LPLAT)-like uncharacterized protein
VISNAFFLFMTVSDQSTQSRRHKVESSADLSEIRRRAYSFDDLSRYSLKHRILIRSADLFFSALVLLIGLTMRWEAQGASNLDSIFAAGHRVVFVFWHACIFGSTWFWRNRGVVVMSSRSRDGEFTARFIKRYGYGTARGSSTRGSRRALVWMSECLASGVDVAFTIDGPRGPAYVAKPGAVTVARHTGHPVLPFHIAVNRYIELPSWDRLQIPMPFSRAVTLIGRPIWVPRRADEAEVNRLQQEVQAELDNLRQRGETWRQRR